MKKVFKNYSVLIKVYLDQSQEEGRTPKVRGKWYGENKEIIRMFFEKENLYSYGHHYQLAKIVGNNLLINQENRSRTTQKQKRYIANIWSWRKNGRQFVVKDFSEHQINLKWYSESCNYWKNKTIRAKKYISTYYKYLQKRILDYNEYVKAFNLSEKEIKLEDFMDEKFTQKLVIAKLHGKI